MGDCCNFTVRYCPRQNTLSERLKLPHSGATNLLKNYNTEAINLPKQPVDNCNFKRSGIRSATGSRNVFCVEYIWCLLLRQRVIVIWFLGSKQRALGGVNVIPLGGVRVSAPDRA